MRTNQNQNLGTEARFQYQSYMQEQMIELDFKVNNMHIKQSWYFRF